MYICTFVGTGGFEYHAVVRFTCVYLYSCVSIVLCSCMYLYVCCYICFYISFLCFFIIIISSLLLLLFIYLFIFIFVSFLIFNFYLSSSRWLLVDRVWGCHVGWLPEDRSAAVASDGLRACVCMCAEWCLALPPLSWSRGFFIRLWTWLALASRKASAHSMRIKIETNLASSSRATVWWQFKEQIISRRMMFENWFIGARMIEFRW